MAINNKTPIDLSGINVGIIMDGNGRWAKKNHLNVSKGHERSIGVLLLIAILADRLF